jgi:23S rRNA U2552 (ribose-2'-O)-methylase RlmE/FtsJ
MRRSKLNEGMWSGDLADLVQPLVSIDEYSSKIDKEAIAIGFYVHDKDAADDLNRFIQKSPISILDSDVSPAPDQRGFYIVFVEFAFNDRVVSNISTLIDEVSPLVSVTEWQMKVRNVEGLIKFDSEKLNKVLKANHISDTINTMKKQIELLKTKGHKRKA